MYNSSLIFFILIYLLFFLLLVITFGGGSWSNFEKSFSKKQLQYLLIIFIGLPPSHMFFFKIKALAYFLKMSMFFEFLLFILINLLSLYIYTQILLSFKEAKLEKISEHRVDTFICLLWGVWLIHPLLFDYWNF